MPFTSRAPNPAPSAAPEIAAETARPRDWRGALAAIDMGSNSFRLEIGVCTGTRYRRVDYLKETVRLGAGLDEGGCLTAESIERALACLARFRRRLEGIPPRQLRAVATQTLREAVNRDAFLAAASATLGHPIEVISGREEARLIYQGVARLQPSEVPRLVIDIGGRSTELILGQGAQVLNADSFRVGSVGLSMQYFADGRYTEAAFHAAQVAAGAEFEEALVPFARSRWREALGSSGTVGAVSEVLATQGLTDGRITREALRWCMDACLAAGSADRLAFPGLQAERRAVIGGGVAILHTLLTQFHIDALLPARGALRQGVIFDLDERLAAERRAVQHDQRDDSVAELQQRFGVDRHQARRVATLALSLHAQLAPAASLECRRELGWVAALHEIGMMVSHHRHHRHSAYLLGEVDAPGFSVDQQRRLADLALAQRGGLGKVQALCADPERRPQMLALRLAVLACHSRLEPPVGLRAELGENTLRLGWPEDWRDSHPHAVHLLRDECKAWTRLPGWQAVCPV